jgi:hypothetical protein
VGDDVVQLRGDPRALVADRERGEGLALALELVGALGEPEGHEVALADRAPGDPGGADDQDRRDDPAAGGVRHDRGGEDRRQQRDRRGGRCRPAEPAAGGERIGAHEDCRRHGHVSARHEGGSRDDRHSRGGHRMLAIEPERGAERGSRDPRGGALAREGGAGGPEEGRQCADQRVDVDRSPHVTRWP